MSCSVQKSFTKVSKEIYKDRISKTKKYDKHEKIAHNLRKKLYKEGKLDFLCIEEPLFIIEGYDIETDEIFVCMKNTKGEINFEFDLESYKIIKEPIYSENLKKMIIDWDVKTIKANEKFKSSSTLNIIVTKVNFKEDGSIKNIENISFSQFDGALQIW